MLIRGRIAKIEYTNRSTGISTLIFHDFETKSEIRALGPIMGAKELETYELDGTYAEDGTFRFFASSRSVDGRQESIDILASAGISVTNALASTIVDTLGDNIYDYPVLYTNSLKEFLTSIKGIGEKKAEKIIHLITLGQSENKAFAFMSGFGVGYAQALQFLTDTKSAALSKLKANPFVLMKYRVPFSVCDKMASAVNIDYWAPARIDAIVDYTMRAVESSGSTRVDVSCFGKLAANCSVKDSRARVRVPEALSDIFAFSGDRFEIYEDDGITYLSPKKLYECELHIASDLMRLRDSGKALCENVSEIVGNVEQTLGITYTKEQRDAFKVLETGGISVLTGGPGCGKTTVIGGIVLAYRTLHPESNVLLLAPTGRAATRLGELSGAVAKTIHKGLGLTWFSRDDTVIEPLSYDFIIVDETSMADTEITARLLSAIKSGTTVLFAGDYNQLSSVGPGRIFKDLCECGFFPTYRLTKSQRQLEGSTIIQNASRILKGEMPERTELFEIITRESDEEILDEVLHVGINAETQVLCPIKKGIAGTDNLNKEIQKRIPLKGNAIWLDGVRFREGDEIIMTNNRYDLGYMNGDTGKILSIKNGILSIAFAEGTLTLELSECEGMKLAYALTVHKSQGSETDGIVLVLPHDAISLARRDVLFTAITRAKKNVTIITTPGMLENYVRNTKGEERDCGLSTLLREKFSK